MVSSLEHLFGPDYRAHQEVAVDGTKTETDGTEYYVWAAVDCDTLQALAVKVFPGRSSLDTFCLSNRA